MRSAHLHPEFGYLCPSPGLRRVFRAILVFSVLGVIAATNSVGSLIADHDAGAVAAVLAASAAGVEPPSAPVAVSKRQAEGAAVPMPIATPLPERLSRTEVAKATGVTDVPVSPVVPPAVLEAAGVSCGTWAHLDGKCSAGKMRKIRVAPSEPVAVAGGKGRNGAPSSREGGGGCGGRRCAVSVAAPATQEPVTQAAATPKKSKRISASDSPRRQPAGRQRAGTGVAGGAVSNQGPFAGLFGVFR
jgi:hypothetical protein